MTKSLIQLIVGKNYFPIIPYFPPVNTLNDFLNEEALLQKKC